MDTAPRIESSADLRQLLYERSRDFRDVVPLCRKPEPGEKWVLSSGLQKAIRRGNRVIAALCAETLLAVDPAYLWRRLPTVALEDVAFGNKLICAATLEASRSSVFRHKVGDRQILHCLVDALCTSVKDRSLTDLLMLDSSNPPRAYDWYRHIDSLALPFLDSYLARYGFGAAALGVQVPKLLRMTAEVAVVTNPPDAPGDELINELPAVVLDKHTAIGKRAFAYYAKACRPVREFFARNPQLDPVKALGITIFVLESAHLDREFTWAGRSQLYQQAVHRDFRAYGMTVQQGEALQLIARENRELLNHARRRIVAG